MQSRPDQHTAGSQQTSSSDRVMIRYLLGDLSKEEMAQLEDEYLADDDTFERLLSVEDDLIDAYVRKELTPHDQGQFERFYLSSPRRKDRVEFARALTRLGATMPAGGPVASNSQSRDWWRRLLPLWPRSHGLGWVPVAAAVGLIAAGAWLANDVMRLRREAGKVEADRGAAVRREKALNDQLAAERGRSEQLAAELQRERAERGSIAREPIQPSVRQPLIALLTLAPGAVRSAEKPPSLTLTQGTDLVRIQLRTAEAPYSEYRAVISTVGGSDVWSQSRLVARSDENGRFVNAIVSTNALTSGDYILTLSGITPDRIIEAVDEYYFRTVRK
jgi:hypothetical protein